MNKVLQLIVTSLYLSLSLPLAANTLLVSQDSVGEMSDTTPVVSSTPTEAPTDNSSSPENTANKSSEEEAVATNPEKMLRFTLQHRFNGGTPLPVETVAIPTQEIEDRPQIILESVRQNFSKHLEKQTKPLQIDTEVEFLLPAKATQAIGKLPKLTLKTYIESNGSGKSELVIPADKREIVKPGGDDKARINWKGLNGHFTFTDKFESITSQLKFNGLTLETDKGVSSSSGEINFSGIFDAHFMPSQIDFSWPSASSKSADYQSNLQNFIFNFKLEKAPNGLDLGKLNFKIGHWNFTREEKFILDDFAFTIDNQYLDEVVNFTWQTKIGKLSLPEEIAFNKDSELSYAGELVFRRLDADALLKLQQTVYELQSQTENPMIFMVLLGKIMEVTPKLLAKSPEIALNQFNLKTAQGNLQGQGSVRLDGTKATSLEQSVLLSALQAQAEFSIGKKLLEQVLDRYVYDTMLEDTEINKEPTEAELAELHKQARTQREQRIKGYLEHKWLVESDDNNYKLVAQLKEGKLTLNGQEVSLPAPPSAK